MRKHYELEWWELYLCLFGSTLGSQLSISRSWQYANIFSSKTMGYVSALGNLLMVYCRCILEASYELHDLVFFQNLGTILLYAVIVCQRFTVLL